MIRGRPFEPGNKFSRGRPRGSRNNRNARGEQLLDQYGEAIVRKALAEALNGNPPLLRTLVSYLLRRPAERPIQIGALPIGSLAELAKSSESVFKKLTGGKLSLGEAQDLADLLEGRRRILETEELEKRVRALEQPSESEE